MSQSIFTVKDTTEFIECVVLMAGLVYKFCHILMLSLVIQLCAVTFLGSRPKVRSDHKNCIGHNSST